MLQIVASLTDFSRGVIYDCNILILQATGTYKGGAERTPILIDKWVGCLIGDPVVRIGG